MVPIETAFHQEIDFVKPFEKRNREAISMYCLLWRLRHDYHLREHEDAVLNGIAGSGLTNEQDGILESKGVILVRDGGVVPSRFGSSLNIQMSLERDEYKFRFIFQENWGGTTCTP